MTDGGDAARPGAEGAAGAAGAARRVRLATLIVAGMTSASRLLGFARDILFARFFFGAALDAWALAFTIPNLFRHLFGEGALSSSFQPIYIEKIEKGEPKVAARFAGGVLTTLALILGAITVVGSAGCFIASKISPSEQVSQILVLTAAMLPYAVLICLAAIYMAILNSARRFAVSAAAPGVMNIIMIAAMFLASGTGERLSIWVLVASVLVGGLVQLVMQVGAAKAYGIQIDFGLHRDDPDMRKVVQRMMPATLGLAVFQLNTLADRVIAEAMVPGTGAVGALYLGNRIVQMPLGIFAIAAATAAMPELSSRAARGDFEGLRKLTVDAIRSVLFWTLPASAGLAILGRPIARFLFEYVGGGEFASAPGATERVGLVIAFYAAGLGAFSVAPILTRAFYAMGDTRTPARVAVVSVGANLALNLIFVRLFHNPPPADLPPGTSNDFPYTFGESGLALASSISFMLQTAMLAVLLWRRGAEDASRREWASAALEPMLAVLATAAFGWLLYRPFISFVYGQVLRPFFDWTQPGVLVWTRMSIAPTAAGAFFLAILAWMLRRRTAELSVRELGASALRLGASATAMGAIVHLVLWSLPQFKRSHWQPFDSAFFPIVAGFLFYWLVVAIFRVTEYEEFRGFPRDKDAGEK